MLTNIPGGGEKDEEEEVVDVMVVLMVQVGSATRVRSDVSEISFSFVFCVGAAIQDRNSWLHLQFWRMLSLNAWGLNNSHARKEPQPAVFIEHNDKKGWFTRDDEG